MTTNKTQYEWMREQLLSGLPSSKLSPARPELVELLKHTEVTKLQDSHGDITETITTISIYEMNSEVLDFFLYNDHDFCS